MTRISTPDLLTPRKSKEARCGGGCSRDTFEGENKASVPVVIDFWAPWCGPCRLVTPSLERLAHAHAGRLKVAKLNADNAPDIGLTLPARRG
jgi:thiol-disulfide isomerase/thioredoxin